MTRASTLAGVLLAAFAALGAMPPPGPLFWPLKASLVPAGDTQLGGLALFRIAAGPKVCWRITLTDPEAVPATAARIHRDVGGQQRASVLALTPPKTAHSTGCAEAPQAVAEGLRQTPGHYMLVVRTATGATLRGQIREFVRVQP